MTTLTLASFHSNIQRVLSSKDTAEPLYLDEHGAPTKHKEQQASITELFKMSASLAYAPRKNERVWHEIRHGLVTILDSEQSYKASLLFIRLMASVGNPAADRLTDNLATLASISVWTLEHAFQDLLFLLRHELTTIERAMHEEQRLLDPVIADYFLTRSREKKLAALAKLESLKPRSLKGEILFLKLNARDDEDAIKNPFRVEEGAASLECLKFSIKKVSAFADEAFIASLKLEHPEAVSELDEIHTFCRSFHIFLKILILSKHRSNILETALSFETGYFTKLLEKRPMAEFFPMTDEIAGIDRLATHPYSVKMFNTILAHDRYLTTMESSADYNDSRFNPEIEIEPFESLILDYRASYRPFFLNQLKDLGYMARGIIHDILASKPKPRVKLMLKKLSSFESGLLSSLKGYQGPALPEYMPQDPERWNEYIKHVSKHMFSLFQAPDIAATQGVFRSIRRDFQLAVASALKSKPLEEVLETKAKMPPKCAGGAGAATVEAPAVLEPEPEPRPIFSKPKTSLAVELSAEINKEPITPFTYAQRVSHWFDQPELMLSQERYASMPDDLKAKMVTIHAFSTMVDTFLASDYSFKTTWVNPRTRKKEDLYLLAGLLESASGALRGVFEYCIDTKTKTCYHRCFRELAEDERLGDYLQKPNLDFDLSFPPLVASQHAKETKLKLSDGRFRVVKDYLDTMCFEDAEARMTISLFKLKS